ncbi:MAG: DUF6471 domain-containing protein [Bacteroidia bacterium]
MFDWNTCAKRILKSELVKRGVTHDGLVVLLKRVGVNETKSGVDCKISRGTFSATFFLQCLNVIGCDNVSSVVDHTIQPIPRKKVKTKGVKVKKQ